MTITNTWTCIHSQQIAYNHCECVMLCAFVCIYKLSYVAAYQAGLNSWAKRLLRDEILRFSVQTRTEPSTDADTIIWPLCVTVREQMEAACAFGISYTASGPMFSHSFQIDTRPLDVPATTYSPSLSKLLHKRRQNDNKIRPSKWYLIWPSEWRSTANNCFPSKEICCNSFRKETEMKVAESDAELNPVIPEHELIRFSTWHKMTLSRKSKIYALPARTIGIIWLKFDVK